MLDFYKNGLFLVFSAYFISFVNSKGIGSECFLPGDCGSIHFTCDYNECKCNQYHIPDKNNNMCVVDILKPCQYNDKCYDPNAECQNIFVPHPGICKCKNGFTLHPEKVVCSVIIGNKCNKTEDCIEGTCYKSLCLCKNPLQPNINRTRCLPALHNNCANYKKCATENAICNSRSRCECIDNYKEAKRENDVFCLAMLGNNCTKQSDCADEGAVCIGKKDSAKICQCSSEYVQNPKVSECLNVATEFHQPCKEDIQCMRFSGFGSECKNNVCECSQGFYFDVDFKRCVRSCLCDGIAKDLNDIKSLMKDLRPFIETMATANNVDASSLLRKIQQIK